MQKNAVKNDLFTDEFGVIYDITNKSIVSAANLSGTTYYSVENGTERIESGCFNNSNLVEINLPDSIKTIEPFAFMYCRKLTIINFGNGLQQVKNQAFSGCNKLKHIHFPKTLTTLDHLALSGLSGNLTVTIDSDNSFFSSDKHLIFSKDKTVITHAIDSYRNKHVKIPNGVKVVGKEAFMKCTRIKSVDMPDSVITVSKHAFDSCSSLEHIRLSKNIIELGECCFRKSKIQEITLPSSLKYIGVDAFLMCSNLVSFQVDNENKNFESINHVLFNKNRKTLIAYPLNCKQKSYTIPTNVSKIGTCAFMDAIHLNEIKFSNTVVEIGAYAFADCTNLHIIMWSKQLQRIKRNAFQNCTKISTLKFPESLVQIDKCAFEFCDNLIKVSLEKHIRKINKASFLNPHKVVFKIHKSNKYYVVINNQIFESRYDIHFSEDWLMETYNPNIPF